MWVPGMQIARSKGKAGADCWAMWWREGKIKKPVRKAFLPSGIMQLLAFILKLNTDF